MHLFLVELIDEGWIDEIIEKSGVISTVYLYDGDRATHLCELMPSYELWPLYYNTERHVDDDLDGEIYSAWAMDNGCIYVHCNELKPDIDLGIMLVPEDEDYDELFEAQVDYYKSNHYL